MRLFTNIPEVLKRLQQLRAAVGGNGNQIPPDFSDALFAPINAGMAKMKQRIFNNGLDAEGKTLGTYSGKQTRITAKKFTSTNEEIFDSETKKLLGKKKKRLSDNTADFDPEGGYTEYEKERLSEGRQIRYKDLEFHGSLRRSIETVKNENKVVIQFVNSENAKIGRYQERQVANIRAGQHAGKGSAEPARIFALSKAEFDYVREQGNEAISRLIKQKMKA